MDDQNPTGVLLINLGTPEKLSISAIRRYLREFLSDPRVIDLPSLVRWTLLNFFILPFRPRKVIKAYESIWQEDGSPLLINSQKIARSLAQCLGEKYKVKLGMRYGSPSIEEAKQKLLELHCDKIVVLPLFPQYASSTTGSALEKVMALFSQDWNLPSIDFKTDFHADPYYIKVLANSMRATLAGVQSDCLLLSYHGLPERHIEKSRTPDLRYCYRTQCFETSKLLAEELGLSDGQYAVGFQSRLGRTPWIKPYSDEVLIKLREQGVKNLTVACPSFIADCLETLEEVNIGLREQWQELGGENFTYIPCLNDSPAFIEWMVNNIVGEQDLKTSTAVA